MIKDEVRVTVACPDCGHRIAFRGKADLGRRFTCSRCGAELKVVKTEPPKLDKAYRA